MYYETFKNNKTLKNIILYEKTITILSNNSCYVILYSSNTNENVTTRVKLNYSSSKPICFKRINQYLH